MPTTRPHPLARLFFCGAGIIAIFIAIGLLPLLGNVVATIWLGHPPVETGGGVPDRFVTVLSAVNYLPLLVWLGACRIHFDRHSVASMGLRGRGGVLNALKGAIAGVLAVSFLTALLWLAGAFHVLGWADYAKEGAGSVIWALGSALLLFIAVGFAEELTFRGYALQNLTDWLGWPAAVGTQAVIFALLHMPGQIGGSVAGTLAAIAALPSLVLVAVFFALCYRKTGSLWFPIGFHFAWNFCLGPLLSFPVSGQNTFRLLEVDVSGPLWLAGGSFGPEASILLIPILGAMVYFISKAPDHPQSVLDLQLSARQGEFAPAPLPLPEPEEEEELRENRFNTKFGSSQGFSAETLRELRDMQEQREKAQIEAREAAREQERLARAAYVNSDATPILVDFEPRPEAPSPVTSELVNAVDVQKQEQTIDVMPVPSNIPAPQATLPVQAQSVPAKPLPVPARPAVPTPPAAAPPPTAAPVGPAPSTPAPTPPVTPETPVKKKPAAPRW